MAEISEAPPPVPSPAADSSSAEPLGDLRNSTRTNKPGSKRLILTLTVLLSFLSGLPFLLKSTEIYRSPLPFRAIKTLSNHLQSNPPLLPCRFQAVFLRSGHDSSDESHAEKLGFQISEEMRRISGGDQKCGSCGRNYSVSVAVDSGTGCVRNGNGLELDGCLWFSGALGISGLNGSDDEAVDGLLESALGQGGEASGGRVYSVVVMSKEDGQGVRVVVGKHRHAWIVGNVSEMEAVPTIGKIFVKFFMNGGLEEEVMGQGSGEFMPVGSDGSVVLSFSLLNANPNDWVYDWEFQKAEEFTLTPVVEALAPIANITVESQVLYHTPKSSFSYWDEKLASYVFSMQDLPFFVNSNEWHLDTSTAAAGRSKVLQLVVYVPSANECPLQLRLPNGEISMTNGFISPMWGGVIVWNPPTCLRNSHLAKSTIPHEDLEKVFQVFMGQLRLLFGLKSNNFAAELGISSILASERGFTKWELDMLFRRHACFNLLSCATSLESLSKLVQSLPRMIVMDEIGKQVNFSLEAATLAQNNASVGIYDASVVSSRQARALAEDAFFHPSIMSISYSSIEHYFAIYMPYFAPVALHVLLAAIKELKRYKQERAKYMAFIASQVK